MGLKGSKLYRYVFVMSFILCGNKEELWQYHIKNHLLFPFLALFSNIYSKIIYYGEDSDRPGNLSGLFRVFAVRMKKVWVLSHWAHIEDSDQTGRMPRLIWVFAGRTCHFVDFVMRWLIFKLCKTKIKKICNNCQPLYLCALLLL